MASVLVVASDHESFNHLGRVSSSTRITIYSVSAQVLNFLWRNNSERIRGRCWERAGSVVCKIKMNRVKSNWDYS